MKARRISEITMQTDEAFVIRRAARAARAFCTQCQVPMVAPEEAAVLFRVTVRAIYREIEAGEVHFQELSDGSVIVCLASSQKVVLLLDRNSSSKNKEDKEIQS